MAEVKEKEPENSCEWLDKAIKEKNVSDVTLKKIIDSVQKEERERLREAAVLFGISEKAKNIIGRIEKLAAAERGQIDLLGMTKRELDCK